MTKMSTSTPIITDVNTHCKTELTENKFYHTWNIENFLKIYKYGEVISSAINNDFLFSMHPVPEKGTVYFYGKRCLKNSNSIKNFSETCLYSVFLNINNKKICKKADKKLITNIKTLLYEIDEIHCIKNQKMYLHNGTLTICFEFHTLISVTNSSVNHSFKPLKRKTDIDIFVPTKISKIPNLSVTLKTNEGDVQVINKLLLCSKSKVFKNMFNSDLQENQTNVVHILDIKYDTLKELSLFVQTGHLSNKLENIDIYIIYELFITAHKYKIKDLKLKCESYLIRNTTKVNVVLHLKIAYLHNAKNLEKYAKDFLKLYLEDIVKTSDFITLMEECPKLIAQIKNIQHNSCLVVNKTG